MSVESLNLYINLLPFGQQYHPSYGLQTSMVSADIFLGSSEYLSNLYLEFRPDRLSILRSLLEDSLQLRRDCPRRKLLGDFLSKYSLSLAHMHIHVVLESMQRSHLALMSKDRMKSTILSRVHI